LTITGVFRTELKYAVILLLPALAISVVVFFTYATTRFTVPALPFMLILAAKGLETILHKIKMPSATAKGI
jgi:hypothetical protein